MVDVFFVYLRAIEPVIVLLKVGVMFVREHILLPCVIHSLRKMIGMIRQLNLMKNVNRFLNTNVHVTSSSSNLYVGTGGLFALQAACRILRGERRG